MHIIYDRNTAGKTSKIKNGKNESWIQILHTALFTILDGNERIHKNLYCKSSLPIFKQVNGYFEEINGNKYITPVPTNESKDKIKKYKELWINIVEK